MNDVIIERNNGQLGRKAESQDAISGLVCFGYPIDGKLYANLPYVLKSIDDAHALGLNDDYDLENGILVYEHVREFFRMNPNGTLWLMVSEGENPQENIESASKLLRYAEGQIKRIGIAFNKLDKSIPYFGDPDCKQIEAVAAAQELAASEYAAHRPILFVMECRKYKVSAPFNIRALNAENVMLVGGQSLITANKHSNFIYYGAVGTALGARSAAPVNVKHSWVDRFNCYGGSLTLAGISGMPMHQISQGQLDLMDQYGLQFFRQHTGIPGYFFNHTATATNVTSDYAYAENIETINKASRLIRSALLPYVESPQKIDAKTGKLSPEVVKQFEMVGKRALEEMLRNDEVSGLDVFVDANQNLLATAVLEIKFEIIPTGSASKIVAKLGFKNPF